MNVNSAIYLRLSRDEEQRGIAEVLHNHRTALIRLAERENLQYEIFEEISSGKNNERPELNKLLQRISDFEYVLVIDQDRLTRDNIYALQLKQTFILNDIKILTPSGQIDFENESDDLSYSFKSMLAEYEWKSIRKRMSRGRMAAAAEGKFVMSNKPPLGYQKDENKRLKVVEEEAKIIRFIFEKILQGFSANRIAKELDMLNWKTRNGKVITTSHISVFRKNVAYYGCISMKRRVNGKVVEEVFVENAHEPIISKQDFLKAQNIIENRSSEFKFRQRGSVKRKLQGLIYCSECGRKRYIQKDGTGTDFIKTCSYKVENNRCEDKGYKYLPVEKAVVKKIQGLEPMLEEALERLKTRDTSLIESQLLEQKSDLQNSSNKLNRRLKNLTLMRSDGELTKKEFEELKEEVNQQLQQIQKRIQLIDVQIENVSNTELEQERLEKHLQTLRNFESLDDIEANTFLKKVIKKIHFSSNMRSKDRLSKEKKAPTINIEFL